MKWSKQMSENETEKRIREQEIKSSEHAVIIDHIRADVLNLEDKHEKLENKVGALDECRKRISVFVHVAGLFIGFGMAVFSGLFWWVMDNIEVLWKWIHK